MQRMKNQNGVRLNRKARRQWNNTFNILRKHDFKRRLYPAKISNNYEDRIKTCKSSKIYFSQTSSQEATRGYVPQKSEYKLRKEEKIK